MLIIAIELFDIFRILKKFKKQRISFDYTLLISFLIQTLIITAYRINLRMINRTVYWADAEYYWNSTVEVLNGVKGGIYLNYLYIYWSALLQILSPFVWVGWNNISNSLLLSLAVLYAARCLYMNDCEYRSIRRFIRSVLWNPLAIYALIRNLKDAFFVFEAVLIIYNYTCYRRGSKHLRYLIIGILLDLSLIGIRPWGCLILFAVLAADAVFSVITARYISKRMILHSILTVAGALAILVFLYRINAFNDVELWTPIVLESARSNSILSIVLTPLRMLTGPGVYRVLMGTEYALFTTLVGNFFLIIGCLLWWGWMTFFILNIRQFKFTRIGVSFAVVLMMYFVIYAMNYASGTEHRMRAVAYLLTSAAFFSNARSDKRPKLLESIIVYSAIAVGATAFSI